MTNLEAGKYIEEAQRFIDNGSFSAPRFWFYSVTLFIIIISLKLKIGLAGAFIIQAAINLFAYLFFYKALKKIFQSPVTPFLIISYLLFFWPYQSWVAFLYTESAFFSAVLILTASLILYKPGSSRSLLFIGLALLMAILSRPLGILLAISVYLYLFYIADRKWKVLIGFTSLLLAAFAYYAVNIVFSTVSDWSMTQGFKEECIICDLPGTPPYSKLNLAADGSPLYQLYYYVTHNFSHFVHFAGIKLRYFFLMRRDYYSTGHNIFLLINLIPVYVLAVYSLFLKGRGFNKKIMLFLVSTVLLFTLTVVFQCDDYHNRFILSIYPFFVLLAAKSVEHIGSFLFKHNK